MKVKLDDDIIKKFDKVLNIALEKDGLTGSGYVLARSLWNYVTNNNNEAARSIRIINELYKNNKCDITLKELREK